MKVYGYVAAAALALAACTQAEEPPTITVSDVQVNADITSVASPQAAAFWGNLESDLSSAIASEFVGQTSPEGWVVAVDVDEIALASFFQTGAAVDDARLTGDVALINRATEETEQVYTVSASANQAAPFLPEGRDVTTISPSSAEFYQAVLRAFARGVAETVRSGAAGAS